MIKFIALDGKNMANGMRDMSHKPLTDEEIEFVRSEIRRINADESLFVFNNEYHKDGSTCYNFAEDKIYVTRNVFPDTRYASTHPRDIMSVGAVLAHEYYGHRTYRKEYLSDKKQGNGYHTTPIWQDECRASITAAKISPNLTRREQCDLIMDAVYRAGEFGQMIEMDDFMKEVVYGYSADEKRVIGNIAPIHYVSKASQTRTDKKRACDSGMPQMWYESGNYDDFER